MVATRLFTFSSNGAKIYFVLSIPISYCVIIFMFCLAEVHPESACSSNQFPCSESGPCVALANRCDGVGDCPNGDDETHCGECTKLV